MTDTIDVLETYEFHVQISEEDVRDGDATPWERVVAAFAAEIRLLREKVAGLEADKRFLNESVTTAALISAHVDHLQADQAQEIRELRERLALQEPDAALGRLVREMPRNAKLGHEGQQWGEWYAVWPRWMRRRRERGRR